MGSNVVFCVFDYSSCMYSNSGACCGNSVSECTLSPGGKKVAEKSK